MSQLWAVDGDPNSHGSGGLIPSGSTVYINGKLVIVHGSDAANPYDLCIPVGGAHCGPSTSSGSGTVNCYGKPVHRNGDSRACGASTVVTGQSTVFSG